MKANLLAFRLVSFVLLALIWKEFPLWLYPRGRSMRCSGPQPGGAGEPLGACGQLGYSFLRGSETGGSVSPRFPQTGGRPLTASPGRRGENTLRIRAKLERHEPRGPQAHVAGRIPRMGRRAGVALRIDGVGPVAMTGASVGHATIQANLAIALVGRLRGTPCRFYGSDLKIQVANDHIRYPDGMIACSPVDRTAKLVRDPVVIFEV
jgi:hypothetical protein